MKSSYPVLLLIIILLSCRREKERPLQVDFDYTVIAGDYSIPVQINMVGKCSGAGNYRWTFEGGEPAVSSKEDPGTIVFSTAGSHKITLEAWNEDQRKTKELIINLDERLIVDFDAGILVNNFSPVDVQVVNKTTGATTYNWIFQGGVPAASTIADPGIIHFTDPGEHDITLEVSNGHEQVQLTKKIIVAAALLPSFTIIPSFDDEDNEAPFTAVLHNTSVSALAYNWTSTGGQITGNTAEHTTITFALPGTYTITLNATNNKETKTVSETITIKSNSNLRAISNVKLGINSASSTIGCFYSTRLRKNFRKDEITPENGKDIDLVYFGLDAGFTTNKFISPHVTQDWTFDPIPGAGHTVYINMQEECSCGVNFSAAAFDAMLDDIPLRSVTISPTSASERAFTSELMPRIVLFQTQDGRKGAIKIKQFVHDGQHSYILADIKLQKESL